MAVTEPGLSSAERSPGSSPSQAARATRRMILAERVRGRSGTTTTAAGRTGLPIAATTASVTSAASVSGSTRTSARRTHSRTATSPRISSGIPMAAASTTAGWPTAIASSSAGPTRLPATFRVSSDRPWRYQKPSRSRTAQSPWIQIPGTRRQ